MQNERLSRHGQQAGLSSRSLAAVGSWIHAVACCCPRRPSVAKTMPEQRLALLATQAPQLADKPSPASCYRPCQLPSNRHQTHLQELGGVGAVHHAVVARDVHHHLLLHADAAVGVHAHHRLAAAHSQDGGGACGAGSRVRRLAALATVDMGSFTRPLKLSIHGHIWIASVTHRGAGWRQTTPRQTCPGWRW